MTKQTPMPETELLPCAHCGEEAGIIPHATLKGIRFRAECENDGCGMKTNSFGTEAEARAAWNQRHNTPSDPVLRWEGEDSKTWRLRLGGELVATVEETGGKYCVFALGNGLPPQYFETLPEAKTAAEQAVRDWLARAGLVGVEDQCRECAYWQDTAESMGFPSITEAMEALSVRQGGEPVAKAYPRMTWAASHKHTCNLCHIDKNPADGCNCGADLIDLIRSEMMSDEHPISEWEVQFAEKIKALPLFAHPPASPTAEVVEAASKLVEALERDQHYFGDEYEALRAALAKVRP